MRRQREVVLVLRIWGALFVLAVWLLLSYLFALAGAPQNVWLWRDVLGVIQ
jgi:cytochrome c oxidase subunit IV